MNEDRTAIIITTIVCSCLLIVAFIGITGYYDVMKEAFKNGYVQVQGYGTSSILWVKQ